MSCLIGIVILRTKPQTVSVLPRISLHVRVDCGVPAIDRTNEIAHSSEFWGWDLPERIKGAPCERETAGMGEQGEDMKDPGGVDFRLFDVRRGWVVRRSTGLGIL